MDNGREAQYIDSLMARFIYLNELRVGVIQFYFAIVAALLAVSYFEISSNSASITNLPDFGVFPLFVIGSIVLAFDMRCRARASCVGQGIRARIASAEGVRRKITFPQKGPIDEDLFFSMIVMIINSILVIPMTVVIAKYWIPLSSIASWLAPILSVLVLVLQLIIYRKWPLLACKMDEWPDDSFLTIE